MSGRQPLGRPGRRPARARGGECRRAVRHRHPPWTSLSRAATVLIPGHAYFEKAGTVTNLEGRVCSGSAEAPLPATQTPTETRVLSALAAELGAPGWPGDPRAHVHRELAAAIPAYGLAGTGTRQLPGTGDRMIGNFRRLQRRARGRGRDRRASWSRSSSCFLLWRRPPPI